MKKILSLLSAGILSSLYSASNGDNNLSAIPITLYTAQEETVGKKTYSDAGHHNCLIGCGVDSLELTIGEGESGGSDYRWHERGDCGNGETVIVASEEHPGEDAPLIKQLLNINEAGIYDFWANFWVKPDGHSDWQIAAALSPMDIRIFNQTNATAVDTSEYTNPPLISIGDSLFLYQAYTGRKTFDSGEVAEVYIDDRVMQVDTPLEPVGDTCRTWFDGSSYAKVTPAGVMYGRKPDARASLVKELLPAVSGSRIRISFSISRTLKVASALFDMRGRLIESHDASMRQPGTWCESFSTCTYPAGIYFCRLVADGRATTVAVRLLQ